MEQTQILLALSTILIGTFLGAVGNKLISNKGKSSWTLAFYIFGGIGALIPMLYLIFAITSSIDEKIMLAVCFIVGISMMWFTFKIRSQRLLTLKKLNPIINKFTTNQTMKILNFLGVILIFLEVILKKLRIIHNIGY